LKFLVVLAVGLGWLQSPVKTDKEPVQEVRLFEMRTYTAAPGKLAELQARFRDHTVKLFEKHGMTNVGYWTPSEKDNPEGKLIYFLAFPSKEAREKAFKEFSEDPEWKAAFTASEANGKLVTKVESLLLTPTDYSPVVKPTSPKEIREPRVFELRIYHTNPGKLDALNTRFRDTTTRLFTKYGMTNVGYWTPVDKEKGAEDTLVYLLSHKSRDAARESFANFGKDPEWMTAREASEKDGKLLSRAPESIFLTPTDYSPIR
jgi:hypothetical protein